MRNPVLVHFILYLFQLVLNKNKYIDQFKRYYDYNIIYIYMISRKQYAFLIKSILKLFFFKFQNVK